MGRGVNVVLCILGICICIDIIFRVFDIHVSSSNRRFDIGANKEHPNERNDDEAPDPPRDH